MKLCKTFVYANNFRAEVIVLFAKERKSADKPENENTLQWKRNNTMSMFSYVLAVSNLPCVYEPNPHHHHHFNWTIRLTVITSITDDITTDFRLSPLMAHFCRRRSFCFWTDWFQAVSNYGCCFHCFLSSCDSKAESSKWLWVMSWWPGNTYCYTNFTCHPPTLHAWRTMISSWKHTNPSSSAPTLWTWLISSPCINSWEWTPTQTSLWARWVGAGWNQTDYVDRSRSDWLLS